jgi:hypothetical protein
LSAAKGGDHPGRITEIIPIMSTQPIGKGFITNASAQVWLRIPL